MKHYCAEEWMRFYLKDSGLDLALMEDHLLECDVCLDLFLLAVDQQQLGLIEAKIPVDFTGRMAQMVQKPVRTSRDHHPRWLAANYVAAAILTVLLMSGGVFQSLTAKAAQTPVKQPPNYAEKINVFMSSWSEQFVDSTWGRIDKLHTLDSKEVE